VAVDFNAERGHYCIGYNLILPIGSTGGPKRFSKAKITPLVGL